VAATQWPGAPAATAAGRQRRGRKVARSSCVGPWHVWGMWRVVHDDCSDRVSTNRQQLA